MATSYSTESVHTPAGQDDNAIRELSGFDLAFVAGGDGPPACQHPNTVICETNTSTGVTWCSICR